MFTVTKFGFFCIIKQTWSVHCTYEPLWIWCTQWNEWAIQEMAIHFVITARWTCHWSCFHFNLFNFRFSYLFGLRSIRGQFYKRLKKIDSALSLNLFVSSNHNKYLLLKRWDRPPGKLWSWRMQGILSNVDFYANLNRPYSTYSFANVISIIIIVMVVMASFWYCFQKISSDAHYSFYRSLM